jgi:hypothetical protein
MALDLVLSQPPNAATLIDPANGTTECPMEIITSPLIITVGFDEDQNSATSEMKIDAEVPINAGSALPRLLELSLVDGVGQFRNEPLHLHFTACLGLLNPGLTVLSL